jgi:hypothetical protein
MATCTYSDSGNNIAPTMTSDTTPAPYATLPNGAVGYRAFDRDDSTFAGLQNTEPWYVTMDYGSGNTANVTSYKLWYYYDSGGPYSWTFLGSNDNSNWTTLHTVTSQTISCNSYSSGSLGNSTYYRYYKFNITACYGTVGIIRELEFFGTANIASTSSLFFLNG